MQSHDHSPIRTRDDDDPPGPYLRRLRDVPQDTVQRLEEEIGRRPATSLGEARAAAYLDGRLRRAGLRASADTFTTRPAPGWEGIMSGVLILLAIILYYWQPLLAILLQLITLCFAIASVVRRGAPLIERQASSQNVIATRAATDEQRHRLVLLAALDTPAIPQRIFYALGGTNIPVIRIIAITMMVAFGLIGLFNPQRLWFYLQFPAALYLLVMAILDVLGKRSFWPPQAAHSAGLAVLLASCEGLDELMHTELWAIGLGASVSSAGLGDIMRRYPFDSATTLFIGLEGLGNGEPVFLTHDARPGRHADPEMSAIAAQVGADPRIRIQAYNQRRHPTIAAQLRREGHRAMSVACLGPGTGTPTLSADALNRATRFVIAMARAVDKL